MTRNKVLWLAAMLGLVLLSSGVILAQKSGNMRYETTRVWDGAGRAWMGVGLADVTAEKALELKLPGEYGAVVEKVEPDSPAAKAGLEKGDAILDFNGERVWSVAELTRKVRETPPGRTVSLRVSRAGQVRTMDVKLESHRDDVFFAYAPPHPPMGMMPDVRVRPFDFHFGGMMGGPRLGIEGDELTAQLAEYFGVKQGKGVLVREVKPGSAAGKAGLKAGDCIVQVDGKEVSSVDELREALGGGAAGDESAGKRERTLTIVRDRHEQSVKVEIEPPAALLSPETAGDELEDLDDEVSELRHYAPEARLQAENLKRQLEAQSQEWRAEVQSRLRQQAAEARRQAGEVQKQLQLQKQLQRDLLDQARLTLEPVI